MLSVVAFSSSVIELDLTFKLSVKLPETMQELSGKIERPIFSIGLSEFIV
jgi:hypothetical protein